MRKEQSHDLKYLISSRQDFFCKGLMHWYHTEVKCFPSSNLSFRFSPLSLSLWIYFCLCVYAKTCMHMPRMWYLRGPWCREKTQWSQKDLLQVFISYMTWASLRLSFLLWKRGKKHLFKVVVMHLTYYRYSVNGRHHYYINCIISKQDTI